MHGACHEGWGHTSASQQEKQSQLWCRSQNRYVTPT
jgi:hypothetical protein